MAAIIGGLATAAISAGAAGAASAGANALFNNSSKGANFTAQGAPIQDNNQLQGQEQALANQLSAQAQGQGPNPALDQLQQTTDVNNKMAAGQIASTKGINPGMAARIASQQGAQNNQIAAGQAATMRANQILGAESALQGQQGIQQGSINANNAANLQNIGQQNAANAGVAGVNAKTGAAQAQGLASGIGTSLQGPINQMFAKGGKVPGQPRSHITHHLMAKGGKVEAMVSPGERYLPPKDVKKVAEGKASPMKAGEKIPGKAKVKGDSYANDTVAKTLESGGIVLPRHITEHPNAPSEAAKFVAAVLAKQGKGMKR